MNVEHIPEPELEFGAGQHIDIRFGLMNYGPFDYGKPLAPKEVKVGIVGTNETIEGLCVWLEKCCKGIPAKESRQPNLFPSFPGYGFETSLPAPLITNSQLQRPINSSEFQKLENYEALNDRVLHAVDLFIEQIEHLADNFSSDVIICALPEILLDLTSNEDEDIPRNFADKTNFDLHDMLKAKVMKLRKHTQLILPTTYDEKASKRRKQRKLKTSDKPLQLQDEATRAWNLYTALYYKSKGIPWRLIRDNSKLTACYIGISFYRSLDETRLQTSIAQVFNELGDGIIVRGGAAKFSKEDRQPHLSETDAYTLLFNALETYRKEHRTLPARAVLHKTSSYNDDELKGFQQALKEQRISVSDFLSIRQSRTRLFRHGAYPPLRGTFMSLDEQNHILYTRGSVDFFETYPGMYIPRPLEFRCEYTEETPRYLAEEILGLSKMNWNKTQFDSTDPITILAARNVGSILKYIDDDEPIQPRYSFYM